MARCRTAAVAAVLALATGLPALAQVRHDRQHPVWTNSLGMPFVQVPAGSFVMGGVEAPDVLAQAYPLLEPKRFAELTDEAPAHRVIIGQAFYLLIYLLGKLAGWR